jgi:hypothetical protein
MTRLFFMVVLSLSADKSLPGSAAARHPSLDREIAASFQIFSCTYYYASTALGDGRRLVNECGEVRSGLL